MIHVEFTIQRRHLVALAGMLIAALLLIPAASWASHQFADVPDTDWAHNDISWLADAGITQGCGDSSTFCPDEPVTRRQMAAFMHRLSGDDGTTIDGRLDSIEGLLDGVTRDGDTLLLSGMNLQVVNGQGSTDTMNGLGNVIVGYNADTLSDGFEDLRTGSHSLIVGDEHTYSAYATLLVGKDHSVTSMYSGTIGFHNQITGLGSVAFGSLNKLTGKDSFVSGYQNKISVSGSQIQQAFIGGGRENVINGHYAFVGGGKKNFGNGVNSFIAGGESNKTANGDAFASGYSNTANGNKSFIAGGQFNLADTYASFITGRSNTSTTDFAFDYGGNNADVAGSLAVDVAADGSFDMAAFPRASVTKTGTGIYNISFDRGLLGCVPVLATASADHTSGVARGVNGSADVTIVDRSTGVATDGAFFLAATC